MKLWMLVHHAQAGAVWFCHPALFPAKPMMVGHSSVQLPSVQQDGAGAGGYGDLLHVLMLTKVQQSLGERFIPAAPPIPVLPFHQIKCNPVHRQSLLLGRKPRGLRMCHTSRLIHSAPDLPGAGHKTLLFSN